ncbi:Uncharacterised protein [Mycobacteroides abscessus subsp. abscessus]|uniref:hypothetical protein n=1 Tax=Mycobacteroides abscessus TaxID=36809 RepID=UPI0009278B27|nr:hypothetical protein [Mycobacteroides abscessus]SII06995.1 Uncharacterised protein [Mycobacteroides abscessus subsp. abscessus]
MPDRDAYRPGPGHVVSYTPSNTWCREGIAIVQDRIQLNGRYLMLDTYWGDTEPSALSDAEADTAELMFKLADYDELDRHSHSSKANWEKYAPADRQLITSQHGLQKRWFIRKGATPDWHTQIGNALGVTAAAALGLGRARQQLDWANQDLRRVISEAQAAGATPKHPDINQPCSGWLCDGNTNVCDQCGTSIADARQAMGRVF